MDLWIDSMGEGIAVFHKPLTQVVGKPSLTLGIAVRQIFLLSPARQIWRDFIPTEKPSGYLSYRNVRHNCFCDLFVCFRSPRRQYSRFNALTDDSEHVGIVLWMFTGPRHSTVRNAKKRSQIFYFLSNNFAKPYVPIVLYIINCLVFLFLRNNQDS